jgi:hypothetical protein
MIICAATCYDRTIWKMEGFSVKKNIKDLNSGRD